MKLTEVTLQWTSWSQRWRMVTQEPAEQVNWPSLQLVSFTFTILLALPVVQISS